MHDIATDNGQDELIQMQFSRFLRTPIARAVTVSLALSAFLLVGVLMSTSNVVAATGPLTVYGTVYDNMGSPLQGADVVVTIEETLASRSTTTDASGDYQIPTDFASNEYDIGDTIRVDVTYNSVPTSESVTVTAIMEGCGLAEIDVHYLTEIPEFGSFAGVAVASIAVGAVAILSMRKRRG